MKIYLVISARGLYDSYVESVKKAFYKRENAEKFKIDFDSEHIINGELFSIIPNKTYYSWPYNEDNDSYADEFNGYTIEQFKKQDERVMLDYMEFHPCLIEEVEIE